MSTTRMMMGKIHCAFVTDANLNYSGSVSVDLDLLEACGLLPNQEVDSGVIHRSSNSALVKTVLSKNKVSLSMKALSMA